MEANKIITYTNPEFNQKEEVFSIKARNQEVQVGYISFFKPQNWGAFERLWVIKNLSVKEDYRKQRIGTSLLKNCFDHIREQKGIFVTWSLLSSESISPVLIEIISLKMLKNIKFDSKYKIEPLAYGNANPTLKKITVQL